MRDRVHRYLDHDVEGAGGQVDLVDEGVSGQPVGDRIEAVTLNVEADRRRDRLSEAERIDDRLDGDRSVLEQAAQFAANGSFGNAELASKVSGRFAAILAEQPNDLSTDRIDL